MDDTQKTQDPEELLTVKQFAEELNLTPQAIYKQLNTRLSPYLVLCITLIFLGHRRPS